MPNQIPEIPDTWLGSSQTYRSLAMCQVSLHFFKIFFLRVFCLLFVTGYTMCEYSSSTHKFVASSDQLTTLLFKTLVGWPFLGRLPALLSQCYNTNYQFTAGRTDRKLQIQQQSYDSIPEPSAHEASSVTSTPQEGTVIDEWQNIFNILDIVGFESIDDMI